MGGSSRQVIGHKYYTNLLLFIGNRIESLLGINFDKRGWMSGSRVSVGDNGELIYLHSPYLYGENEGGVSGTLCLKYGTNNQLPDASYKKYMESIGLPASGYPYQSYISFSGGELLENLNTLTQEQLQDLADQYNDGVVPGQGFYVGNSGYMKEMLLWPKRIHVRNDGREQWYDEKAEIDAEFVNGMDYVENMPSQNNIYTIDYLVDDARYQRRDYSRFPGIFLIGLNWSEGAAKRISAIARNAPKMLYKVSGELSINQDTESPITVIGEQFSAIKVTKRTNSNIRDFEFLAMPDDFGDIGANFSLAASSYIGIVFYFTIVPYLGLAHGGGGSGDINPIHKIRELITDDTAMKKPESSVNDANFMKAADRIWDEGLGVSWSITEKSCVDAINELCYHIEAGIRVNRQTGLYEIALFRDDWFSEEEIHTITENKIKKGSMQYEITNADEVINQVNVNYYNRANIKNSSFSISESGLIQTLGRVNAETVDFPYFMNMRNAEIVANWKLKILSTGVLKGSFTTGWREARKWNRYDLIRLPWSKRWIGTILVRIMNIKLGGPTSNEVSIEWVEVVPSTGMMNTTIVADDPVDTQPEAPKPCNAKVFELPYFEAVQAFGEREVSIELTENPEVGYLCAIAEKPQNNSLNAALYADSGSGFERVATVNYCETAYLDQTIDRISSSFVVKNVGNSASIRVGSQIFINDETMVFQSYDAETKVLIVKRGAFGTPQNHPVNSILYFADDFVAVDQTLYVDGEIIDAKVLTTTPSGVLALDDATTHEIEFNAKAIRPYPPANVKINGAYWPAEIETDLVLTWVDRNRVQQTGGEILGWYEGGVTLESGTTYQLILIERDENDVELRTQNLSLGTLNTYTFTTSAMDANTRTIEITLKSLRDGYECYQSFTHTVELSQFFSAPYDLTVEFKND